MTLLNKKVRRETGAKLDLDSYSRGRPIIVALEPPNLITFSFKGQRKSYSTTIEALMQSVITAEVEANRKRRAR